MLQAEVGVADPTSYINYIFLTSINKFCITLLKKKKKNLN